MTRRSPDARHYPTHLQLLTSTSVRRDAWLDAIANKNLLTPDLSKKENRLFEWYEGGAEAE